MTNARGVLERREIPERRDVNDRRICEERRLARESAEDAGTTKGRTFSPVSRFALILLAALLGYGVYRATGLCEAVDSVAGHVVYGGGIVYGYVVSFMRGIYAA